MRQTVKRKPRQKKDKSTFLADPLESAITHLGKFIDKLAPRDLVDLGLYGGLAYIGQKTFGFPNGMLVGPIAFRLATTQGGGGIIPAPSQIAGLAMLGYMGLNLALGERPSVDEPNAASVDVAASKDYPPVDNEVMECTTATLGRDLIWRCPETYTFHQDAFGNIMCCRVKQPPAPIEEPIPDPPASGWTDWFTQGLYLCRVHECGQMVCGLLPAQLEAAMQEHIDTIHPPPEPPPPEPPPPEPPPPGGWTEPLYNEVEGWCTTHIPCGSTVCSFNIFYINQLRSGTIVHTCPAAPNGVE